MLVSVSVREVMTAPVETVTQDATALDVVERLAAANVGSLVITADGAPCGIVTESDVVRLLARDGGMPDLAIEEFASRDLVTVGPDATIEEAAELLDEHDIRRLPVVADGELVGIVTTTDISYYLPSIAHRTPRHASPEQSPRYSIRASTAYEGGDWEFEYRSVDETEVGVGDVVEFVKTLDDADVRSFAEASGDTNRLHLDEEYARKTRFGERIVHGTLVAGLVSAALARLPGVSIYLSQELSFLGPVHVGDRVTAVCEVVEALGGGRYLLTTEVYDDDEGELVIEGEAVVLVDELPEDVDVEVEQLA